MIFKLLARSISAKTNDLPKKYSPTIFSRYGKDISQMSFWRAKEIFNDAKTFIFLNDDNIHKVKESEEIMNEIKDFSSIDIDINILDSI